MKISCSETSWRKLGSQRANEGAVDFRDKLVKYRETMDVSSHDFFFFFFFLGIAPDNFAHCPDEAPELSEAALSSPRSPHQIQHL